MRDFVIRVSGPWDAKSEDKRGAIPIAWNSNVGSRGGTLPSADVEAKLKKLTIIDFKSHNWSWLLNPNKPPVLSGVQRVPVSGKRQLASEPEEPVREENNSASATGEPTQGVGQPTVNLGKPRAPGG